MKYGEDEQKQAGFHGGKVTRFYPGESGEPTRGAPSIVQNGLRIVQGGAPAD